MKLIRLAVVIWLWGCLQTAPVLACRYNVREVGFIDLGSAPYYFYGYVSEDTAEDITSSFAQISRAALRDNNIHVEIINTSRQRGHPAMKYLDLWPIQSFPAAVLVSPEGQSLAVPVRKADQPFKRTLWSALDDILSSPKREEILRQVSQTYGVVLLIEGAEQEENKEARQAALGAIEQISIQMKTMPKPIAQPPALVVIERQSFSREKVLLWSLGLDADKISRPHIAILYGRMRRMGPVLRYEEITEKRLTSFLYVIGQDCECGLDRKWMQGVMLPARWDQKIQAQVANGLGFDPESPMVKMEVSHILSRGFNTGSSAREPDVYPSVPFGYQELVIEFEPASEKQEISLDEAQDTIRPETQPSSPSQVENTIIPEPDATKSVSKLSYLAESEPAWQKSLYLIAGFAVLIIAVGMFIVFRAVRRN